MTRRRTGSTGAFKDEGDVKKAIKALLKKYGWWYYMPNAGAFGTSGIPDFVCLRNGVLLAIEAKFGYNKPSDLQETRMEEIREHGGFAIWINESRLDRLEIVLRDLGKA